LPDTRTNCFFKVDRVREWALFLGLYIYIYIYIYIYSGRACLLLYTHTHIYIHVYRYDIYIYIYIYIYSGRTCLLFYIYTHTYTHIYRYELLVDRVGEWTVFFDGCCRPPEDEGGPANNAGLVFHLRTALQANPKTQSPKPKP